jgi:hypothetical protein
MTAINLDLDKKFSFNFKRKVTVGGHVYEIVFNDALAKALRDLQVEIEAFFKEMTKDDDRFGDMTVVQQQDYLTDKQHGIVKDLEKGLDAILGKKGAGKAIYEYYDQQSYALFQVIKVLRETKDKLDGTALLQKQAEQAARRRQYIKKPKGGKRHAHANR